MPIFRIADQFNELLDGLSIRKSRDATKAAMGAMAWHWHRNYLPLHFEPFSSSKYRYKARTPKWIYQKQKIAKRNPQIKKGGRVANVFTGLLEESMKQRPMIRAYPTRATVQMHGPRYITMRPYKSNQPNKAAEITTVIDSEQRTLGKVAGDTLHERIKQHLSN